MTRHPTPSELAAYTAGVLRARHTYRADQIFGNAKHLPAIGVCHICGRRLTGRGRFCAACLVGRPGSGRRAGERETS